MSFFMNTRESMVQDAVNGLVAVSGGRLARLDGFPHIRVVTRVDWDKSKVAVISGGGSGHEPAHAGFVGEGMLTAAVCGDIFASPSVDAVLAAILSVTGSAGCLLIVKNYTGDRLNFGLAAERARSHGLKVKMVIVDDDIALSDQSNARGVAGTLFVHKVAGEVSEAGGTLDNVTEAASRAASSVMTVGVSLDTCTIPGSKKEDRIEPGHVEVGLGIHGEPGVEQIPFSSAKQLVADVVNIFKPRMGSEKYAVLVNNLGGATSLEMAVLAREICSSSIASQISYVLGPTSMMTALDMHGFSISLYPLTLDDELLLREPSPLKNWPGLRAITDKSVLPVPDGLKPATPVPSSSTKVASILTTACSALINAEHDLNALDAKVGDGDTGTTVAAAAKAVLAKMDKLPLADNTQLLQVLGQELSQTMGGSSGVLLAIFFSASGDSCLKGNSLNCALLDGLARVKEVGGADLGDRTMIDALEPALKELDKSVVAASCAARTGANLTASMKKAAAGRSAYLRPNSLEGIVDPGAEAVACLFESLADNQY